MHFEPLTPDDETELRETEWAQAVFAEVWPHLIGEASTFKLVCTETDDRHIQGLLRVGNIAHGGSFLKKSLLETAPFNQYSREQPRYRGVGGVLIARLVVESYRKGGQGRVSVRPRPGTEPLLSGIRFSRS